MNKDYFLVHKSLLPKNIELIIEAKSLVDSGQYSVSDACKKLNITRTKYYKYKDLVMLADTMNLKKAELGIKLVDEKGTLSNVLKVLSNRNANVLKINQEVPRQGVAFITLSINIFDMEITIDELISEIELEEGVCLVNLLALD